MLTYVSRHASTCTAAIAAASASPATRIDPPIFDVICFYPECITLRALVAHVPHRPATRMAPRVRQAPPRLLLDVRGLESSPFIIDGNPVSRGANLGEKRPRSYAQEQRGQKDDRGQVH